MMRRMLLKDGRKLVKAFIRKYFTEKQRMATRLDLLKYSVNQAGKDGLFLEFGVWKGDSLKFLAEVRPDIRFYGFDSFEGLPEWWSDFYPKGHMKLDAPPYIPGDVILVKGLFQDVLDLFLSKNDEPVSFLHLDADLYSSTKYVLFKLAEENRIKKGTIIEFDEIFYQDSSHTILDDEYRVYNEFIKKYDVRVKWLRFFQRRFTTRASLLIESFEGVKIT